jgi:hypothetical protein
MDSLQVVDFYGVAIPLAGIMIATEGKLGFVWALGVLLLGSAVACAYVAFKLFTKGNITLGGPAYYS